MKLPQLSLIELGPISIHFWGLMVGAAFFVGYFYALRRAKKFGIAKNHIQNIALIVLILAIIGARVGHFALFPAGFLENPTEIFRIDQGGMVFVTGFILSLVGVLIYCRLRKVSFWRFVDCVAPVIALSYGIGRIGCILTDIHPGIPTSLPWGVEYGGVLRHPTALYSSLAGFLIWFGLLKFERKLLKSCSSSLFKSRGKNNEVPHQQPGKIALAFLLLFTVYRFSIDFVRAWDLAFERRFWGLTLTQYFLPILSIFLIFKWKLNKGR